MRRPGGDADGAGNPAEAGGVWRTTRAPSRPWRTAMRHLRPTASVLMALGLVLAGVGSVAAKGGDAIATLDEPLPPGPAAGSTITIGWSLDLRQDDGTTLPFWAEGVFLRFTPPSGSLLRRSGTTGSAGPLHRQGRGARGRTGRRRVRDARRHVLPGHLRLELRVLPRRGHDRGRGRRCRSASEDRGRACPGPRSAARGGGGPGASGPLAPVADPAADPTTPTPPAPAPRTAPSVDGAWLAALMVIGLALTGIVIAARGRGRTSAA